MCLINKKYKVIIDTDPGVDDTAMLVFALTDPRLDIKLLSTVSGNLDINVVTNNLLHLLEKMHKYDIPVVKGSYTPLYREAKHAAEIHSNTGLGGYIPQKAKILKPLDVDPIEKMYEVIKENAKDIYILLIGPQTNMGQLILKHPDVIKMVKKIIYMGGNPWGYVDGMPFHVSFNASSDPEAFDIVNKCGIPTVMVSSDMGRCRAFLSEQQVYQIKNQNKIGEFLYTMYSKYWEPGFKEKIIATNDTITYMYLMHPNIFKSKRGYITIDEEYSPGKTYFEPDRRGPVVVLTDCNRKKYFKLLMARLKKLNDYPFS